MTINPEVSIIQYQPAGLEQVIIDDNYYLQDASAVEHLIQSYPSYVTVDSLPLEEASTEEKVADTIVHIMVLAAAKG